jgi:hypothetical protein
MKNPLTRPASRDTLSPKGGEGGVFHGFGVSPGGMGDCFEKPLTWLSRFARPPEASPPLGARDGSAALGRRARDRHPLPWG